MSFQRYEIRLFNNEAGIAKPKTKIKVLKNLLLFYDSKDYTRFPLTSEILTDNKVLIISKIKFKK